MSRRAGIAHLRANRIATRRVDLEPSDHRDNIAFPNNDVGPRLRNAVSATHTQDEDPRILGQHLKLSDRFVD